MNSLFVSAENLLRFIAENGWEGCIIGGLANLRWGEPRVTKDVDLSLLTGWGREEEFVDALLARYPLRLGSRDLALRTRVLLLLDKDVPVDIALGAIPFERDCVARSSEWMVNAENRLRTCSAEDLIVHKVFAGRDRDWSDVEGVVRRQRDKLNLELIRRELPPLLELKHSEESLIRFEKLVRETSRPYRETGDSFIGS